MKHRTLKTMLAAVLILCTLLPLPAANAKTKYTVEVKKTDVEADVAFNTNGYASLTRFYRLSEEEKKAAYQEISEHFLEDGETFEDYLKKNSLEDMEDFYLYYAKHFGKDRYQALMDKNGKIIMPFTVGYNSYYVSDGIIAKGNEENSYTYADNGSNGYFDLSGNRINKTEYLFSRMYSDGIAFVRRRVDGYTEPAPEDGSDAYSMFTSDNIESCLIDKNENVVLRFPDNFSSPIGVGDSEIAFGGNFSLCGEYSEGLIGFCSYFKYKDSVFGEVEPIYDYLTGYMDINGNIIIPQDYYTGGDFHSGMAWVQEAISNKEDDSFFATKYIGGKCGYINKSGELVIPYIYDAVKDFDGEYAAAKKDGKWGLINKKGETVIPFEYNFMGIYDGIITCSKNNDSPLVLMTADQEVVWQLDADSVDNTSAYNDGVLYYTKDGYVHVVTVTAEEEKDGIMGDADGNGKITAADARYSLRASVGLETVTEELLALLDVNKDKAVTAADARLILRASVGLEDQTKW